jgi:hypothetical protein
MELVNKIHKTVKVLVIAYGTFGACALARWLRQQMEGQIPLADRPPVISYDAEGVDHSEFVPMVDHDLAYVVLPDSDMLRAKLGDLESRRRTGDEGRLSMVDLPWIEDPGAAVHGDGMAGNVRNGRATAVLNGVNFASQVGGNLRKMNDYSNAHRSNNGHTKLDVDRITVTTLLGGMGAGSFGENTDIANREAELLGLGGRNFGIYILCGTIKTPNRAAAIRNQQLALKSLRARYDGRAKPLAIPRETSYLSEASMIISNVNNSGEIATMEKLKSFVAKLLALLASECFGKQFRQRVGDLHDKPTRDRLGRIESAGTIGFSTVHLNKSKLQAGVAARIVVTAVNDIAVDRNEPAPAKQAETDAEHLALVEAMADDGAVKHLLKSGSVAGSVVDRAISTLQTRRGTGHGVQACMQLRDALHYVKGVMIPGQLTSTIEKTAKTSTGDAAERVNRQVSAYLKESQGIHKSGRYLGTLRTIVDASASANLKKLSHIQQTNKGLTATIDYYDRQCALLSKTNWLVRLLSFVRVFFFLRRYPKYAEMLVRSELELAARITLSQLLLEIKDILDGEATRIDKARLNLAAFLERCVKEQNRLRDLPDDAYVPIGIELGTPALTAQVYNDTLAANGGQAEVAAKVFGAFVEKFHGMDAFLSDDLSGVGKVMRECADGLAKPEILKLHAYDVFKSSHSTPESQREQIHQRIRESCGRLVTVGQANREIPSLKYIITPDSRTCDEIRDIANGVTRLGGDWQSIVWPGIDEILFVWYRASVSIPALIEETYKTAPRITDYRILYDMGEDPVIILAPDYDGTFREIDRTLVHALSMGAVFKDKSTYMFHSNGLSFLLGSDLDAIRRKLVEDHQLLTRMHMDFAAELARRQKTLVTSVENTVKLATADPLTGKMAAQSLKDAIEIAELLLPNMKRIRLAE